MVWMFQYYKSSQEPELAYTFVRLSLIFEIYFRPIKAVIDPQTQAPTTTHTSNTVTNFDVAVLILINQIFYKLLHLFRNLFNFFFIIF